MHFFKKHLLLLLWTFIFINCNKQTNTEHKKDTTLFKLLDSIETGVKFQNTVYNQKDFNIFNYRNFYNGGGVALGDINNDGLPDMYLTSNLGENKLYLNKGNFQFQDISESSGSTGKRAWSTGVVMVDINADGFLDIYVCNAGNIKGDNQKNELFINNGDLTFTDAAETYNLADSGFTTHTAFFDYDKDGDLDAYILNNSFLPVNTLNYSNKRSLRANDWELPEMFKGGGDKLFRNDNNYFVDVSEESGIYGSLIGFGLGVAISDINNDSYPDIYVSNDFYEHDYLYINNQDGTFTEDIKNKMSHSSMFSMGGDIADINNDGRPDIFVTDMHPEGDERLKNTTHFDSYDLHLRKQKMDFYNQSMHNTLQLNLEGNGFFDIANYANVAKTDWSWGALIFDMDNDGYKDIYVCNGIYRDLTNQDFIDFFANDIIRKMVLSGKKEEIETVINKMPSNPIPNYTFKNNKDLTFSSNSAIWGLNTPSFSNGAAYGDLDNDGDLDLIVNNLNQPLFIYQNLSQQKLDNNFIKLKLKGNAPNTYGIGSVVEIFKKDGTLIKQELVPTRGFQSSIDYTMTIGLGKVAKVDSLKITWPNNDIQYVKNIAVDTTLTIYQNKAANSPLINREEQNYLLTKEIKNTLKPHKENHFIDFDYEGLIYEMISREGPAIAVGDVNNDGHDDIYLGGSREQIGSIYIQDGKGNFTEKKQTTFVNESILEDTAAIMFDADNDGDQDLLVGSGGNETNYIQTNINRLYFNNGDGSFEKAKIIPATTNNVSVITAEDFDDDGDIDVFIGARSIPGIYGVSPKHLLLENDGNGNFLDITKKRASDLMRIGMITDAIWEDIDNDTKKELIITTDWGSPVTLKYSEGKLSILKNSLNKLSGRWNTIVVSDLDGDGDNDLILGNQGVNSPYIATEKKPMKLFVNDFDDNGTIEQIITLHIKGQDKPITLKQELTNQLPHIKKQNLKFSDYSKKSIQELFSEEKINSSIVRTIVTNKSTIALNQGNGNFKIMPLPKEAQFSNINALMVLDVNNDGVKDIIFGGNNYNLKPQFSRLDANYGGILLGNKNGYKWTPYSKSGFLVKGEIKNIVPFTNAEGKKFFIVGINNQTPKTYTLE